MSLWTHGTIQQYEKYLGLPPMVGKSKKKAFAKIRDQIWHKIESWKEKNLSQGEKEVLLKVVALSIPTFTISCFKLMDIFCDDLSKMMMRFWWGQKEEERKIHWVSWDKLCFPKCLRGMGFEDLKLFNLALLAKQRWRILQNKESLVHKIYGARYFPHGDFFEAKLGAKPSFMWRGIWEA